MFDKVVGCLLAMAPCLIAGENHKAAIAEIKNISSVLEHIDNDSVVLFNITGTLYESSVTFSDKMWRDFFEERVHKLITDKNVADKIVNTIKNDIVNNVPKRAIEDMTAEIINGLQNRHIPVFGITQKRFVTPYAGNFGEITSRHIAKLGVNLQKSLVYAHTPEETQSKDFTFAYGILFTKSGSLDKAFDFLLNNFNSKPKKVIVVDNSQSFLEDSSKALKGSNVEFVGLRYSHGDEHLADFYPDVGIIQFLAYMNEGKILSDEAAKKIKFATYGVDHFELLDEFIEKAYIEFRDKS